MLIGRYANLCGDYSHLSDLAVDGDLEDLLELAALLENNSGILKVSFYFEGVDPSPYDGVLKKLRAEITDDDKLLVKCTETTLEIRGTKEHMRKLAHNVHVPARETLEMDLPKGGIPRHSHIHVEWYPNHFYLDENSDPLVVTANKP